MSDDIRSAAGSVATPSSPLERRLVPLRVGAATVYVVQVGEPLGVQPDDEIRPVAPLSPQNAFESAGEIVSECVRAIGNQIEVLASKARPDELSVEFSLSFEAKGKSALIPIFVTGEVGAQTGLKVTAVWKREPASES